MSKKQREGLADFVRRILKETGLTTSDVEQRAKRKGKRINSGYVSRVVSRTATNLTIEKLKALAAGLGVREEEVFNRVLEKPLESDPEYQESDFAFLFSKYKDLSESDKRELRTLIQAISREIEWRLTKR
jgi:transcriptional regulator with XRE-family HTH domain